MMRVRVPLVRLPAAKDLPLPSYATEGAAGLDLLAAVEEDQVLPAGGRDLVPTGLRIAIPQGYEGQVRMRSGLALRSGLLLPNAPGTIDSDYRGELKILVMNAGTEPFRIRRGDRIAQLVITPVARAVWDEVSHLEDTERGSGGFGHTGARGARGSGNPSFDDPGPDETSSDKTSSDETSSDETDRPGGSS